VSVNEILHKKSASGKGAASVPIVSVSTRARIFMDTELAQSVVMVTGASGGIGGEVVRTFRAEGARVAIHYGRHSQPARALAAESGPPCTCLGAELSDENEVASLFGEAEQALGPVSVLIANAGQWPADDVGVVDMSLSRWRRTLDVNLTSVFLCVREFFRGIRRHGLGQPAAVLVGSTAAIFGEAGHADYAAAKAGLASGLVLSLKNEISQISARGRVNAVCPGWTLTPMVSRFEANAPRVRRALQTMPLRKLARPTDVAMAILFLASAKLSGHINGQILTVAGGMEGRVLHGEDQIDLTKA
jgi:3-oxoacyl-[acyl-carrier protein] reductase